MLRREKLEKEFAAESVLACDKITDMLDKLQVLAREDHENAKFSKVKDEITGIRRFFIKFDNYTAVIHYRAVYIEYTLTPFYVS